MFKMIDRYFKHRAAMDIMNLAVNLTSDAIFRGEDADITAHINKIEKTAKALAKAHIAVCTELEVNKGEEVSYKDKEALGIIFNHKDK